GGLPELHAMSYGARIGYLGLNLFLPTVPASFFTFSQYPLYALYELGARVRPQARRTPSRSACSRPRRRAERVAGREFADAGAPKRPGAAAGPSAAGRGGAAPAAC